MFVIICLVNLLQNSVEQDISAITDLQTLSELPLEKLLKLKNSFDPEEPPVEDTISTKLKVVQGETPEALALHSKRKTYGGGYETDYHKKKEKDTSSIFQMSVTTLAFLAFGGYLLCLIIQALKAKNNTVDNDNMLAMLVKAPNRRVPIRQTTPGRRPRPGNNRYKREVWPDANPHGMYDALIMLAEGYSKYHTVDYKHLNASIRAFD